MPVMSNSAEQAREELAQLQESLKANDETAELSSRQSGLGAIVQATTWMLRSRNPQTDLGQLGATLLDRARREHMTFRDLYNVAAAARGRWAVSSTRCKSRMC